MLYAYCIPVNSGFQKAFRQINGHNSIVDIAEVYKKKYTAMPYDVPISSIIHTNFAILRLIQLFKDDEVVKELELVRPLMSRFHILYI